MPTISGTVCFSESCEGKQEHYLRVADTILESSYMDDSMDSSPSKEECVKLYEELSALWRSAGMHTRN